MTSDPALLPLRALFVNQGVSSGAGVLGHGQVEAALRIGLEGRSDIAASFRGLPPLGPIAHQLRRRVTRLGRWDLAPVRWSLVRSADARRLIRCELARSRPDVLHLHTQTVALLLGRLNDSLPTVLSVDSTVWEWQRMTRGLPVGTEADLSFRSLLPLERRAMRRAFRVLAWTDTVAGQVARACPEARILVHHPGVDLTSFHPGPKASGRGRVPSVLFVGSRFQEKGGEVLLKALSPLLGTQVNVEVVTREPVRPRPGMRVWSLGPGDPQLRELFRTSDVLCLPTVADAVPWAVLEAMASGTAVVATATGSIPEMMGDTGVALPDAEPASLRAALTPLLASPDRCRDLGHRARVRCEEKYDARRQTALLVDVLRQAVDERRSGVRREEMR